MVQRSPLNRSPCLMYGMACADYSEFGTEWRLGNAGLMAPRTENPVPGAGNAAMADTVGMRRDSF